MQSHRIGQLGAVALLALPTQAFAQIATPAPPIPELLRVTRTDDNGEGSLRWAIERNNAAPGRFRIEIDPAGQAPYVIKPASALPPIKGPVRSKARRGSEPETSSPSTAPAISRPINEAA